MIFVDHPRGSQFFGFTPGPNGQKAHESVPRIHMVRNLGQILELVPFEEVYL